jgi:hypothetical protein
MSRDARKRMAVSLRRPRTAQVVLRHRLLLPHSRLVRNRLDFDQALPQQARSGYGDAFGPGTDP